MSQQEKMFVVVNPTLDKQVALERALITAQLITPRPEICVFVAVDSNTVNLDARNPSIYRDTDWFEQKIHTPFVRLDLNTALKSLGRMIGKGQLWHRQSILVLR